MRDTSVLLQIELIGRLVLAVLFGGILGFERQMGRHPAGLRTHVLVSLGAAAFTVAGTFGVFGLGTNQDPGRIAAQIVAGIGFLGAGTIWRSGSDRIIYGLTTAASIWVAASIGMLCGYGLYVLAAGCAVLGLAVLRLFKGLEQVRLPARRGGARQSGGEPSLVADATPSDSGAVVRPAVVDEPVMIAAVPAVLAQSLPDLMPGAGRMKQKRLGKRKKEQKGKRKRRDTADDRAQISDAPLT